MTTRQWIGFILIIIGLVLLLMDNNPSPPPKKDEKSVGDVDFSRVGGTQKTA